MCALLLLCRSITGPRILGSRAFSKSCPWNAKKRRIVDETTLAGAQHKPSLSGPSLGHLISELSATRPGMTPLRVEGHTNPEGQRTQIRQLAKWILALPVTMGVTLVGLGLIQHGGNV